MRGKRILGAVPIGRRLRAPRRRSISRDLAFRFRAVAALIVMVAAAVGAVAGGERAVDAGTFPGTNGRIAFEIRTGPEGSRRGDIATVNPDGSGFANLTTGGTLINTWTPDWSADGTAIAFIGATDQDPNGQVWTMSADGSNKQQRSSGTDRPDTPSWSPDGTRIVFTAAGAADGFDLFVLDLGTSATTPITSYPANVLARRPAWSPNGARIAFTFVNAGGEDPRPAGVYTINPDGSDERLLSSDQVTPDSSVSWSPDGAQVVYDIGELAVINSDGTGRRQVPNTAGAGMAAWSPDGRQLVFQDTNVQPSGLNVVNTDGAANARIFADPGGESVGNPSWGTSRAGQPTPTTTSTTTAPTTTTTQSTVTTAPALPGTRPAAPIVAQPGFVG